jgi:hypothetical protein
MAAGDGSAFGNAHVLDAFETMSKRQPKVTFNVKARRELAAAITSSSHCREGRRVVIRKMTNSGSGPYARTLFLFIYFLHASLLRDNVQNLSHFRE